MHLRYRSEESGAEYYVRELPDGTIAWIGESPQRGHEKAITNVFLGKKVGEKRAIGLMFDVPKGTANGAFRNVELAISEDRVLVNLPGLGQRTLVPPTTEFPVNDFREWGAGFYDEAPGGNGSSLTGAWKCDDGGTYYVREHGDDVAWLGEHPSGGFSNVFFGKRTGGRVEGRWVDVPKGGGTRHGQLAFDVTQSGLFAPLAASTELKKTSQTGGFGGGRWHKTDSVRVAFRLFDLRIERNADVGGINRGGDEPYLMPVHIVLGGNEYSDPAELRNRSGVPRARLLRPLEQHEWGRSGDWPKNNLTWQEDLAPESVVPVPEFISYAECELRTFRGLQPNSALGRSSANFIPCIIGMEEASTRNEDIRAGYAALTAHLPGELHKAIAENLPALASGSSEEILNRVRDALTAKVVDAVSRSAVSDFFGLLGSFDPDKSMGVHATPVPFGMLRDAALRNAPIPLTLNLVGGAGGRWRLRGAISGSRAPADGFRGALWTGLKELEVTIETGDDDKREGSRVELAVEFPSTPRSAWVSAHAAGLRLPDRTRQVTRFRIDPPNVIGPAALHVRWVRDPGNWPQSPDSWILSRVRVTAFDALNHRVVLLYAKAVNARFDGNRTLRIPLDYT